MEEGGETKSSKLLELDSTTFKILQLNVIGRYSVNTSGRQFHGRKSSK